MYIINDVDDSGWCIFYKFNKTIAKPALSPFYLQIQLAIYAIYVVLIHSQRTKPGRLFLFLKYIYILNLCIYTVHGICIQIKHTNA